MPEINVDYTQKNYCYARWLVWGMALVALVFYSSCDRSDDTPKPNYELKCPDAFEIDCTDMDTIGSYSSQPYVNKVTYSAPSFLYGSNEDMLFAERNKEDVLAGMKLVRYNWKTRAREVLLEHLDAVWRIHAARNGRICLRLVNGSILHFHIDSAEATLKRVPYNVGAVRDPSFLSDGETIVFTADSNDGKFRLNSFNIHTKVFKVHKLKVDGIGSGGISTGAINNKDDLVMAFTDQGFYKINFHNTDQFEFIGNYKNMGLIETFKLGNKAGMYYAGYQAHHIKNDQDWLIRPLCRQHLIEYMDISHDDNFLVYTVDIPVEYKRPFLYRKQELRIIDIANCKEYNISPFD